MGESHGSLSFMQPKETVNAQLEKANQLFQSNLQNLTQTARNALKMNQQQRRVHSAKQKKTVKGKTSAFLQACAEKIFMDQDLNLPYGFGFDEFISRMKESNLNKQDEKFIENLKKILIKLNLKNEKELIQLYKDTIAREQMPSYKNKASLAILQKLIQEVQHQREDVDPKVYFQSIVNEYLSEPLSPKQLDHYYELLKNESHELQQLFKPSMVESEALALSKEAIQKKINDFEELEKTSGSLQPVTQRSQIPDVLDLLKNDPIYKEGYVEDSEDLFESLQKYKASKKHRSPEEQKVALLMNQVRKNYFENKLAFVKSYYETEENEFQYKETGPEDAALKAYLKKHNLYVKSKTEFEDIYENIDFLIQTAPLALKRKVSLASEDQGFDSNFVHKGYSPSDLLWSEVSKNFETIFPHTIDKQEAHSFLKEMSEKQVSTDEFKESYLLEQDLTTNQEETQKETFSTLDLSEDQQFEMEIYKNLRQQPFFQHFYLNNIKFFADRMEEGIYALHGETSTDLRDMENLQELEYVNPFSIQRDQSRMAEKQDLSVVDQVVGVSKRKSCTARCILKPGKGVVTINKTPLLHYFPCPMDRRRCLKSMEIAGIACEFDLAFYIEGGGTSAQTQAACQALTRAICKKFPVLRPQFLELDMLKTDSRKVERKHTGLYKARAKYPYKRR